MAQSIDATYPTVARWVMEYEWIGLFAKIEVSV